MIYNDTQNDINDVDNDTQRYTIIYTMMHNDINDIHNDTQ